MSGITDLVPAAELLGDLAGDRAGAVALAARILTDGAAALPRPQTDVSAAARAELQLRGVVASNGSVHQGRSAELLIVTEILAVASSPAERPTTEPRLVFSTPPGSIAIADRERLDGLVLDVIRRATTSLVLAGAFWNTAGFEILEDVLLPAIADRGVDTAIYVNRASPAHLPTLRQHLAELESARPVRVRWFVGNGPTMLHAKAVVRDRCHGYLGTANLTSWGMREHIEAGIELTAGQSERLVRFLEELDTAGLFQGAP
jgi:phosphatidylserine/phosphatidylglycerophosphate/cardiolipin synthase-like enzyme